MTAPGPADPLRSVRAPALLEPARAAARAAGVTRLAELTRLDCLGLPVWQAVRPMSRALSVHQGKGVSDADAQLGALMEALESHHAEAFEAEGPRCSFEALAAAHRPADLADVAADRRAPPDSRAEQRWVEAVDLSTGEPLFLPFDLVSLDLTRHVPSPFDRSSNGIAAGASRDEAITVALQEAIERDAVTEWRAGGIIGCTASALDPGTLPFDWFHEWRERIRAAGAALRCYRVPSIGGTPVVACELQDFAKEGAPYRATQGSGCHALPELALFKALAEAIQCRATAIAGAREDLPPPAYGSDPGTVEIGFGLPLPRGMTGVSWSAVEPGPADLVAALGEAGYPQIAAVSLATLPGIAIAKVHVCGLGGLRRRRRLPR